MFVIGRKTSDRSNRLLFTNFCTTFDFFLSNCSYFSNTYFSILSDDGEIEEKNIDFSVRQKLTPSMCDLLIVFIDSTITIVTLAGATDSFKTTEDSENLKNTLNELCGEKNIPVELNLLRRRLNKIL